MSRNRLETDSTDFFCTSGHKSSPARPRPVRLTVTLACVPTVAHAPVVAHSSATPPLPTCPPPHAYCHHAAPPCARLALAPPCHVAPHASPCVPGHPRCSSPRLDRLHPWLLIFARLLFVFAHLWTSTSKTLSYEELFNNFNIVALYCYFNTPLVDYCFNIT